MRITRSRRLWTAHSGSGCARKTRRSKYPSTTVALRPSTTSFGGTWATSTRPRACATMLAASPGWAATTLPRDTTQIWLQWTVHTTHRGHWSTTQNTAMSVFTTSATPIRASRGRCDRPADSSTKRQATNERLRAGRKATARSTTRRALVTTTKPSTTSRPPPTCPTGRLVSALLKECPLQVPTNLSAEPPMSEVDGHRQHSLTSLYLFHSSNTKQARARATHTPACARGARTKATPGS
mmetsp:Transcript_27932/g.57322  ORF Transcript_27932/g.57322 Transcript_27932/m.57322 type:complete len:239 (-) Transcript_27932:155-871(-)